MYILLVWVTACLYPINVKKKICDELGQHMTAGKVHGTSKLEKQSWKIEEICFFLNMRQFGKKNPQNFRNCLKWPTLTYKLSFSKLLFI